MPDDAVIAYERARELVGDVVWEKLSDVTRAKILDEELLLLATEQIQSQMVTLT